MFESTLSKRAFSFFALLTVALMFALLAFAEETDSDTPPDPLPDDTLIFPAPASTPEPGVGDEAEPPAEPDTEPVEASAAEDTADSDNSLAEDSNAEAPKEPPPTIWDKPFAEYTPTEGYLFLLFVLILSACAFKLFKGGF